LASSPWIRRCPQRVLLRQANGKAGDARDRRRAAGLAPLLVSYLLAASLRCQASSVAGVTGKISAQRRRGSSRSCREEQKNERPGHQQKTVRSRHSPTLEVPPGTRRHAR